MAKRHTMRSGDWVSIIRRIQELVLANSGEDDFEEIFKLLIAKLFSEKYTQSEYKFIVQPSPSETSKNINFLLAKANEEWKGIFRGKAISNLTDEHLTICVESLQDYSILDTSIEILDHAFEFLVNKVYKGSKGQYFTPRHVIDCCIKILDPSPFETVMDPACGSAGFLVHTMHHIQKHYPEIDLKKYCRDYLWGFDFDRRAIQVAKALMLIAGDGHSNLFQLNSILPPKAHLQLEFNALDIRNIDIPHLKIEDVVRARFRKFKGFDIIITNPPFAGEIKEKNILEHYSLYTSLKKNKRIERDVIFLERCVNLLKPGGKLGIILPNNKLSSNSWNYLREWLIKHIKIVSILGLGRCTFLPYTHQKTAIIFGIKREKPISNIELERILFLISEKEGKDSKGQFLLQPSANLDDPAWLKVDHDLDEVVTRFHNFIQSENILWSKNLCLNTLL